jgi:hypothetical protein
VFLFILENFSTEFEQDALEFFVGCHRKFTPLRKMKRDTNQKPSGCKPTGSLFLIIPVRRGPICVILQFA